MREPIQLELPLVQKHERDLDYYWERHERHMKGIQNPNNLDKQFSVIANDVHNDNVYIYDLDYTTFERPKIFTHKPRIDWKTFSIKWDYSLSWYIFWDSFIVSLFDKPLPLAQQMKDDIKWGLKVGIFSARSEKWYSNLWVRLKIGKVSFAKFRPAKDETVDHELKERYLKECLDTHQFFQWSPRIIAYDDKEEIIEMYKQNDVEGVLVK